MGFGLLSFIPRRTVVSFFNRRTFYVYLNELLLLYLQAALMNCGRQ
jgi:hypothetical protein